MVLGFKPQFVEPILNGTKIHTIREDKKNRWQYGRSIQMATGVRTKNYKCFAQRVCLGFRTIEINPNTKTVIFTQANGQNHTLNDLQIELLALNDGFKTVQDFWNWFNKPFKGKLIFWNKVIINHI